MIRFFGTVFFLLLFVPLLAFAQESARTYEAREQRFLGGDPRYIVLHDGPADYGQQLPTTTGGAIPVCYVCDDEAEQTDETSITTTQPQPEQTWP